MGKIWFFYSGTTTGDNPKFFNGLIVQDRFEPGAALDLIRETQVKNLGVPEQNIKVEVMNRLDK